MRKSFDALSGLVRNELGKDPANGEVFVFLNRNRSCLKLLHWESGGFVLYYKRLEKGTFSPPAIGLSKQQLITIVEQQQKEQLYLKAQIEQYKRMLFGQKRERFEADTNQLALPFEPVPEQIQQQEEQLTEK